MTIPIDAADSMQPAGSRDPPSGNLYRFVERYMKRAPVPISIPPRKRQARTAGLHLLLRLFFFSFLHFDTARFSNYFTSMAFTARRATWHGKDGRTPSKGHVSLVCMQLFSFGFLIIFAHKGGRSKKYGVREGRRQRRSLTMVQGSATGGSLLFDVFSVRYLGNRRLIQAHLVQWLCPSVYGDISH